MVYAINFSKSQRGKIQTPVHSVYWKGWKKNDHSVNRSVYWTNDIHYWCVSRVVSRDFKSGSNAAATQGWWWLHSHEREDRYSLLLLTWGGLATHAAATALKTCTFTLEWVLGMNMYVSTCNEILALLVFSLSLSSHINLTCKQGHRWAFGLAVSAILALSRGSPDPIWCSITSPRYHSMLSYT